MELKVADISRFKRLTKSEKEYVRERLPIYWQQFSDVVSIDDVLMRFEMLKCSMTFPTLDYLMLFVVMLESALSSHSF